MPKIKKDNETEDAVMSNEMLKKCKDDIAKFGFDGISYTKFLISVGAMKNKLTVIKYPNSEIDQYRDMFIKKNESSIGDNFMLDKFKIKSSDANGHSYDTGYFVPRGFWDYVRDKKAYE